MNMLKLITALTLASALMVIAMPSTALATTVEQNQKLEQEIKCSVSGYGQANCEGKQYGEQSQKISLQECIYKNGKCIKIHTPAGTGVDTAMALTGSSVFVAGIAASIAKFMSR